MLRGVVFLDCWFGANELLSNGTRFREPLLWPLTEESRDSDCSWETTLLERMAQELCQSDRLEPTAEESDLLPQWMKRLREGVTVAGDWEYRSIGEEGRRVLIVELRVWEWCSSLVKGGRQVDVIGEEKKSVECSPASHDPSPTTIFYTTFVFFFAVVCLVWLNNTWTRWWAKPHKIPKDVSVLQNLKNHDFFLKIIKYHLEVFHKHWFL